MNGAGLAEHCTCFPVSAAQQPLNQAGHGAERGVGLWSKLLLTLTTLSRQEWESVGKGVGAESCLGESFHPENELLSPRPRAWSLWLRTLTPVGKPLIGFQLLYSQEHSGQSSQRTVQPQAQPRRAGPGWPRETDWPGHPVLPVLTGTQPGVPALGRSMGKPCSPQGTCSELD